MQISKEDYMKMQLQIFDLTTQLDKAREETESRVLNTMIFARDVALNKLVQRAVTAEKERDDFKDRFEKLLKLNKRVLEDNTDIANKSYDLATHHQEVLKEFNIVKDRNKDLQKVLVKLNEVIENYNSYTIIAEWISIIKNIIYPALPTESIKYDNEVVDSCPISGYGTLCSHKECSETDHNKCRKTYEDEIEKRS
jgi:hypothetical protein